MNIPVPSSIQSQRMNPVVKEKWVEALRSGKYQQGINTLHRTTGNEDAFCCLGILCDLAVLEGVPMEVTKTANYAHAHWYDGSANYIPATIRKWAGLSHRPDGNNPRVPDPESLKKGALNTSPLAVINDNKTPFSIIADLIEEFL